MRSMEKFLSDHNFSVSNLDYPSRHFAIPKLAQKVRQQIITISEEKRLSTYHFVTHSMGGIILRQIQATNPLPDLGRVVMLGPPNQGSEIVDKLGKMKVFNYSTVLPPCNYRHMPAAFQTSLALFLLNLG